MKIGLAKVDITPRVGVPLCGFGPFLHRVSIGIRDRLWARAMAVEQNGRRVVIISCDLVGVDLKDTERARKMVQESAGVPGEAVMVCCSHTHSGPDSFSALIGWGGYDPPYMELLPRRIAAAALEALSRMQEARLLHAEVPCEGIGLNREYDKDAPPLEEVLQESWRPAKPELTDTTCHVLRVEAGGRMIGFASYFGCHPVCCCQTTRYIHGDYAGVATNLLERETPGSVGLFFQGAAGDVNSCVVHKPEPEAMLALDVIASRYARAVRRGLQEARPIEVDAVAIACRRPAFTRRTWQKEEVLKRLAEEEAILHAPAATDSDTKYRLAVVRTLGLRRILSAMELGENLQKPTEVQGIRLGPISLLASGFETFQAIKNDVKAAAKAPIPLVMGLANDSPGYAPDRTAAQRGGYAADMVPLLYGFLPYAKPYEELPRELLALDAGLR